MLSRPAPRPRCAGGRDGPRQHATPPLIPLRCVRGSDGMRLSARPAAHNFIGMRKTCLLIACAWFLTVAARADDWPHWRGPAANGTAPKADPPLTWDDTTNIKWK